MSTRSHATPRDRTRRHAITRDATRSHATLSEKRIEFIVKNVLWRDRTRRHAIARDATRSHAMLRDRTRRHTIQRDRTRRHAIQRDHTRRNTIPRDRTRRRVTSRGVARRSMYRSLDIKYNNTTYVATTLLKYSLKFKGIFLGYPRKVLLGSVTCQSIVWKSRQVLFLIFSEYLSQFQENTSLKFFPDIISSRRNGGSGSLD